MPENDLRGLIRATEHSNPPEQWALLCFLAGRDIALDEHEVGAALRRAALLLAAGGDPRRPLELDGRAVTALAEDLDDPAARADLAAGLDALVAMSDDRDCTVEILRLLRGDPDLAWRCYAMALLADELADEE